jgi:hypothetical protein
MNDQGCLFLHCQHCSSFIAATQQLRIVTASQSDPELVGAAGGSNGAARASLIAAERGAAA